MLPQKLCQYQYVDLSKQDMAAINDNDFESERTYPVVEAVDVPEGFTSSFQDKMIFLSPINEGAFECRG